MSSRRAWEVVRYHDEPEDAATDNEVFGPYFTEAAAVKEATRPLSPDTYWNGGATVHAGTYYPAVFGKAPERFEDDEQTTARYFYELVES